MMVEPEYVVGWQHAALKESPALSHKDWCPVTFVMNDVP
jgi:hypothetical protein